MGRGKGRGRGKGKGKGKGKGSSGVQLGTVTDQLEAANNDPGKTFVHGASVSTRLGGVVV